MDIIIAYLLGYIYIGLIATALAISVWTFSDSGRVMRYIDFLNLPARKTDEETWVWNGEEFAPTTLIFILTLFWPLFLFELIFTFYAMIKCEELKISTFDEYLKKFYPEYYQFKYPEYYERDKSGYEKLPNC